MKEHTNEGNTFIHRQGRQSSQIERLDSQVIKAGNRQKAREFRIKRLGKIHDTKKQKAVEIFMQRGMSQ